MRELAELLFGRAPDEDCDLFEPDNGRARVRDSGEWCQSAPGHAAIGRLGSMLRAKGETARNRSRGPWH